jgi:hypothetical protein
MVKLSLCSTNQALRHEDLWGSGCIYPYFLDLSTSWRWVLSFATQPLYPRGKNPWYPLDRRLGGPQSQSGRYGEVKIRDPTGTRTLTPRSSSPCLVTIHTALSWLFPNLCIHQSTLVLYMIWGSHTGGYEEFSIFLDITPCSPLKINRHFGRKFRLHLQGR